MNKNKHKRKRILAYTCLCHKCLLYILICQSLGDELVHVVVRESSDTNYKPIIFITHQHLHYYSNHPHSSPPFSVTLITENNGWKWSDPSFLFFSISVFFFFSKISCASITVILCLINLQIVWIVDSLAQFLASAVDAAKKAGQVACPPHSKFRYFF